MPDTILREFEYRLPQGTHSKSFTEARRKAEAAEPMFALWRAALEARRAYMAAGDAEEALAQIVIPQRPQRPDNLHKRHHCADGEVRLLPLDRVEIEDLIERERKNSHLYSQQVIAGYEKRLRALDAYEAECDAVDLKCGLTVLQEAAVAAEADLDQAEDNLAAAVPSTLRGIAIKLRFVFKRYYYSAPELEDPPPKAIKSAIRDLVRLRRATNTRAA